MSSSLTNWLNNKWNKGWVEEKDENGNTITNEDGTTKKKWISDFSQNFDFGNYDLNSNLDNYAQYGYYDKQAMASDYYNDYNAYIGEKSLNENKQAATGSAAKIKDKAITAAKDTEANKVQYADMRRQLMEKYIPETLLAQGIANTGYTADALLKAENLYNQYAHNAMSERASAEQNALSEYNLAEQNALSEYNTALNNLKMSQNEQAYKNFIEAEGRKAKEEERQRTEESTKKTEEATLREIVLSYIDEGIGKEDAVSMIGFLLGNDENKESMLEEVRALYDSIPTTVAGGGGNATTASKKDDVYNKLVELGLTEERLSGFTNHWNNNHAQYLNRDELYTYAKNQGLTEDKIAELTKWVDETFPTLGTGDHVNGIYHDVADPNMGRFNFSGKSKVKSGDVKVDGKKYNVKTESGPIAEDFAADIYRELFYEAPKTVGTVFLYKGGVYILGDSYYEDSSPTIWKIDTGAKQGKALESVLIAKNNLNEGKVELRLSNN